jgi:hypothetical protein
MINQDLDIFFDIAGFASLHTIGATTNVVCIVGEETTVRSEIDGTWVTMFEVTVKKTDIPAIVPGQRIPVDGHSNIVDAIRDDGAVLEITFIRVKA